MIKVFINKSQLTDLLYDSHVPNIYMLKLLTQPAEWPICFGQHYITDTNRTNNSAQCIKTFYSYKGFWLLTSLWKTCIMLITCNTWLQRGIQDALVYHQVYDDVHSSTVPSTNTTDTLTYKQMILIVWTDLGNGKCAILQPTLYDDQNHLTDH